MDKLYEAAEFYKENLAGRKFHLIAVKNKKTIEFDIVFGVENFKHLLGLNKLTDLQIGKVSSEAGFLQILGQKTTLKDIEKSQFYDLIAPRLDNFKDIKETLSSEELMVKSLHGEFNCIRADFMLTGKNEEYGYAHLFLKGTDITFPVTFIIHPDNSYLRNNPNKWNVLSVEEIRRPEKSVQRTVSQSVTRKNRDRAVYNR